MANNKTLVIYFSVGGVTRRIAEYTELDTIEVIPVEPYTEADLLTKNKDGRIMTEQSYPLAEPEMADLELDWTEYNHVIIGFPLWHNKTPKIVSKTLISRYYNQLSAMRTIDVFCTSGGGAVPKDLQTHYPNLPWGRFQQFGFNTPKADVKRWSR